MHDITLDTHVATIARELPATIKVFQRRRLDFCCGGKRPLTDACAEAGLDGEALLAELRQAAFGAPEDRDWASAPLPELSAHIVARYHQKLRRDLPVLRELAAKVAARHGGDRPALLGVRETVDRLAAEMLSHMEKEENVLFPMIDRAAGGGELPAGFPMLPFAGPIEMMEHEHREVADMLAILRQLTAGHQPPAEACNSFRGLYAMLAELEADTHVHIHLENNVLFPRAAELQAAAVAG